MTNRIILTPALAKLLVSVMVAQKAAQISKGLR